METAVGFGLGESMEIHPSSSMESMNGRSVNSVVDPGLDVEQQAAVGSALPSYLEAVNYSAEHRVNKAVESAHPVDGAFSAPEPGLGETTETLFRRKVAQFKSLDELTKKDRGTLDSIRRLTAGQVNSRQAAELGDTWKKEENFTELDNLVKMANVLQEVAVSSVAWRLPTVMVVGKACEAYVADMLQYSTVVHRTPPLEMLGKFPASYICCFLSLL